MTTKLTFPRLCATALAAGTTIASGAPSGEEKAVGGICPPAEFQKDAAKKMLQSCIWKWEKSTTAPSQSDLVCSCTKDAGPYIMIKLGAGRQVMVAESGAASGGYDKYEPLEVYMARPQARPQAQWPVLVIPRPASGIVFNPLPSPKPASAAIPTYRPVGATSIPASMDPNRRPGPGVTRPTTLPPDAARLPGK